VSGAGAFRPSIGELIDDLETNPKRFPKKKGPHDQAYEEAKRRI
jgi:hypothetical protein